MRSKLHHIGNSQGVIIPKPFLAQVGLTGEVEMEIERDSIVLRKPRRKARADWAEASAEIIAAGEDQLAPWLEFANEEDAELEW